MIVTQYDAVAEIEALKARRRQPKRLPRSGDQGIGPAVSGAWSSASEQDIRAEMERRLAKRAGAPRAAAGDAHP